MIAPLSRSPSLKAADQSTIAQQHRVEPGRFSQLLRGELDWIVMKAMEKDRNRRYESASALGADVERYLHDEPVEAYPPSNLYPGGAEVTMTRTEFEKRQQADAPQTALQWILDIGGALQVKGNDTWLPAFHCAPYASVLIVVMLITASMGDEIDIRYGGKAQQTLDIYSGRSKQESANRPVVVWVRGGGWRNGDKDNRSGQNLCKAWAQAGVVMVNLNYRLTPDVMHPAHVEDVAAGISWVHKNIDRHDGAPKRIFLLGHSAGAHLVALVATNPKYLKVHDLTPQTLAGVMPIDTASYELASTRTLLVRKMIRDAFGDKPEVLAEASPLVQAKQHIGACPPFVIAVTKQPPEAWKESIAFKEALANSKLIVMDYPGSGQLKAHAEIARDLIDVNNDMTKQLLTFVKEAKSN